MFCWCFWLEKMWSIIEYLKDPYLVLKVQHFYGIRKIESPVHEDNSVRSSVSDQRDKGGINDFISKPSDTSLSELNQNGVLLRAKKKTHHSDCEDVVSSDSETESRYFTITNWFWYYLFIFGTELGDEIFYATFIPFWFWNIDGAVGRRVVMVWTIIMYIG